MDHPATKHTPAEAQEDVVKVKSALYEQATTDYNREVAAVGNAVKHLIESGLPKEMAVDVAVQLWKDVKPVGKDKEEATPKK
jgi:hypothetical protein